MKHAIEHLLQNALKSLQASGELPAMADVIHVEHTKDKSHGDYATNLALVLAKSAKKSPRAVAERLVAVLESSPFVTKVEIAGPGFINFFLSTDAFTQVLPTILKEKNQFGRSSMGRAKTVLVEFVSSNPTGPLHVGHGRHAAFGSVMCRLLDAVGFKVTAEYYVNDAGRQMDILTASIWLRYLALCGEQFTFPSNAYRGEYVIDIAKQVKATHGNAFVIPASQIFNDLPKDEPEGGDKEIYIDAVITRAKALLGDARYLTLFDAGLEGIMADIKNDLESFGVHFDDYFSERDFVASGVVDDLLKKLEASGHVYEKEGALWFRATDFGDEKDRVLVRSNGTRTYFANDVAYHLNKFERGFDIAIDIFGSDHHGYVPRMKAAVEAAGINPERLLHLLGQFVTLYRGGQQVSMSTRGGDFVTLRELREEVGNDAARFFYVMRRYDNHIDFDLDLAKSQSNENPVYYLQYAHARICSVFRQAEERGLPLELVVGLKSLNLLVEDEEKQLMHCLSRYPDMIVQAALDYEPHQLTNYLREVATLFHAYYNAHHFMVDDAPLRQARLTLLLATRQILQNGFELLGINAPDVM